MAKRESKQDISDKIEAYFDVRDGSYSSWYVGITNDVTRRVFNEHGVDEKEDWYIFITATSESVARDVEDYFHNVRGCDGEGGGGKKDTDIVYAYKENTRTNP